MSWARAGVWLTGRGLLSRLEALGSVFQHQNKQTKEITETLGFSFGR